MKLTHMDYASANEIYAYSVGDAKYVIKIQDHFWKQSPELQEKHFFFELDMLRHLDEKGISVLMPLPQKDGRLWFRHNGKYAMLWEHVNGGTYQGGELLGYTAQELARLHLAGKDLESAHMQDAFRGTDHLYNAELYLALLRQEHIAPQDIEMYRQTFKALQNSKTDIDTLEHYHIHGDMHPRNVFYIDNHPLFYDFQLCRYAPRILDIAEAMIEFGEAFLEHYEQTSALKEQERDMLPLARMFILYQKISGCLQLKKEGRYAAINNALQRYLGMLQMSCANPS